MCLAEAEPQGLRDCWEAGCVLQTDFYDRLGRYPIFARSLPVRYTGATRSHVYTIVFRGTTIVELRLHEGATCDTQSSQQPARSRRDSNRAKAFQRIAVTITPEGQSHTHAVVIVTITK